MQLLLARGIWRPRQIDGIPVVTEDAIQKEEPFFKRSFHPTAPSGAGGNSSITSENVNTTRIRNTRLTMNVAR